jgi:putative transposase
VIRCHRQAWKLFWRWRSRGKLTRPRLSQEARELIATMSRGNPLRGTERVRSELLKVAIAVSNRSIRRYRWRGLGRSASQTWRRFLANHRHQI